MNMIESHHGKKYSKYNVMLASLHYWVTNIISKKKKKPKIIELYICRDRELENTFRNSSNF